MPKAPRYNEPMSFRLALTCALVLSVCACAPRAQHARARTGLQNYLQALRADDPRPVYEMLSEKQRTSTTYKAWSKRWQESKAERNAQATQIEESLRVRQGVDEDAQLLFEDGRTMSLARAAKGWRLNEALLGRNQADQPDDALRLFATAIRERDIGNLLQILSKRHRTRIQAEVEAFYLGLAEQLATGETSPYLLSDSRAELAWNYEGLRYKLVLIKEEGEWVIDDVHMGPDPTFEKSESE